MRPVLISCYQGNAGLGYAELFGEITLRFPGLVSLSYGYHLVRSELGFIIRLSLSWIKRITLGLPVLSHLVFGIIRSSSEEKMIRVSAVTDITCMENAKVIGDWTVDFGPHEAVRPVGTPIGVHLPVSIGVLSELPEPAGGRFFQTRVKALHYWYVHSQ